MHGIQGNACYCAKGECVYMSNMYNFYWDLYSVQLEAAKVIFDICSMYGLQAHVHRTPSAAQ